MESDNLQIVNMLKANNFLDTEVGLMIQDIKDLFPEIGRSIFHVGREKNNVAHLIAKWAISHFCDLTWSGSCASRLYLSLGFNKVVFL